MSKKMLINASHPEENRVAIVVDGILSELDIELAGQEQSKGNIYKAVVVRVETGLQAAFVDYGAEKLGFLQIGEIHPNIYPARVENKNRPRIADILHRGQEILVQIVKEERGSKGAALTTFLSIPGRYMVLMPDSTTKGVSRKISDESERKKLKKTMAELDLPERMGYIVRTAGIGKDKEELKRDFDYLVRLYEGIVARKDQIKAPSQLYQESNLAIRSIRDYFSADMDEVLVDDEEIYQDAKDFFALVMPEMQHLVKRHRERRPIFSRYQIEEQIDGLSRNQMPLPSGGSIVIDQTEALVAIDVNSGKMASESGIEATALKTNLEAAAEVGRQLRLRDLGGLIVVDFIDMRDRKNIRQVEQELRKALKDDKAKVSVGRISQFGLLEMSRQRLKPVLSVGAYLECPHCKGIGRIKSVEAQAVAFLRQAHTAASKGHIDHIEAYVPIDVANYLLNQKRKTIRELEQQLNLAISILGSEKLLPGEINLELHKREKEADNSRQILPISHANQIEVALAAIQQEEQQKLLVVPESSTKDPEAEELPLEETQEPAKKRRRRRRKKPSASDKEPGPEAVSLQAEEAPEETTATVSASDTAPAPANDKQAEQSPPTPPTPEKKPRRRTRKSPRKTTSAPQEKPADTASQTGQADTGDVLASEQQEAKAQNKTPNSESITTQPPAAKKVARRTRKPSAKKKQEAAGQQEATPVSDTPEPQTTPRRQADSGEKSADKTEGIQLAVETAPAAIGTKKAPEPQKAQATPRPPAGETTQPEVAPSAVAAGQKPAAAKKPQRRSGRTATQPAGETAEQSGSGGDKSPAKTPKRRPRRTTKSAEESERSTEQ